MLAEYDEDEFEYWDYEGTNQGWEKQKPGGLKIKVSRVSVCLIFSFQLFE